MHGLGSTPVQSVTGTQRTLTHCWVGEQFGCSYSSIVKFTLPLKFDLVSCTSNLLHSCHCLFISGCQVIPVCGDDVTKRLTRAAMPIAPTELVYCISFCTISIYTKVRQFRQAVFASVACMLYGHPIGPLHVKQQQDSFLTVLVITGVSSRGDQTYSIGFKNLRRNTLLHADAIIRDSRKTSIFPICKNSRPKTRQPCLRTVKSS